MTQSQNTVRDNIRAQFSALTQSERKFANALLENYPSAGLASITVVAEMAGVSTPTVARMVQKLGYKGFPQFHDALLDELKAQVSGPAQRRENWVSDAPEGHLLNRFSSAVSQNLERTFSHIERAAFD